MLSVLGFHFSLPGFSGGFAGVDVFFAISGFLMTGIVVTSFEAGRLSLLRFLGGRIMRTLPALALVCAVALLAGWKILAPQEYRELAVEALSSLTFWSNILFWTQSGYFDSAAHDKWLLHTWSLSLEWQFYLLLPLMLLAAWRFSGKMRNRAALARLYAIVGAGSFAACAVASSLNPVDAFYALPARAWEFLAGGWVWLHCGRSPAVASDRAGRVMELAGIVLLLGSTTSLDRSMTWPGWLAMLPVAGASLVLAAARQRSLLTAAPALQWIGLRSYSIYLWHWPIAVGLGFAQWQNSGWAIAAGIAVTLLLSDLSYRYVENRFRLGHGRRPSRLRMAAATGIAASVLAAAAFVYSAAGIADRLPRSATLAAAEAENRYPKPVECREDAVNPGSDCRYGEGPVRAILIGDSHANAVASALAEAARSRHASIRVWEYAACPWLLSAQRVPGLLRSGARCAEFNQWAIAALREYGPDIPIVLVSRTSVYAMGPNEEWENGMGRPQVHFGRIYSTPEPEYLDRFAEDLASSACRIQRQRPVYLMRPIPEMGLDIPKTMSRALALGRDFVPRIGLEDYRHRHRAAWLGQDRAATRCGVRILDPLPLLCRNGACPAAQAGRPYYYDDNHLSEFGNRRLVPMFAEIFEGGPDQRAATDGTPPARADAAQAGTPPLDQTARKSRIESKSSPRTAP